MFLYISSNGSYTTFDIFKRKYYNTSGVLGKVNQLRGVNF